jgi:hypothetical protein
LWRDSCVKWMEILVIAAMSFFNMYSQLKSYRSFSKLNFSGLIKYLDFELK